MPDTGDTTGNRQESLFSGCLHNCEGRQIKCNTRKSARHQKSKTHRSCLPLDHHCMATKKNKKEQGGKYIPIHRQKKETNKQLSIPSKPESYKE